MTSKEQFVNGILKYADEEILPRLSTGGKWAVGTAIVLATQKTDDLWNQLLSNPMVKSLGIICEDGKIDSDRLLDALFESSKRYGNLQVVIPVIGTMTFTSTDISKVKSYVNGG